MKYLYAVQYFIDEVKEMEKLKETDTEKNDMINKINELIVCNSKQGEENAAIDERLSRLEEEAAKNLLAAHLSAPMVNKQAMIAKFKELSSTEFIKQHGIKIK